MHPGKKENFPDWSGAGMENAKIVTIIVHE